MKHHLMMYQHSNAYIYIRKLLTLTNDHEILKGASFNVQPDINAPCQRMPNKAHKDVLPGGSHAAVMEAIKGKFDLRASSTTGPGLLTSGFEAMACPEMRPQRGLLGLSTARG